VQHPTARCHPSPVVKALTAIGLLLSLFLSLALPSTAARADTQVRTSAFEYNAQGLLTKEVVEPDQSSYCLQTVYSYDAWGNRTTSSTSDCLGGAARTSQVSFGADGRFAVQSVGAA